MEAIKWLVLRKLPFFCGLMLMFMTDCMQAKVLIMTHSYNRPDFIRLHYKTFQKFLKDDYEYVVFNDGPTEKLSKQIQEVCQELAIRCFTIPQEIHQLPYLARQPWEDWNCPSVRTANAIQYSFSTLGFDYSGIVAVIDSDMFLIKEFSIEDYMKDYDLSAVAQWRGSMGAIKYIWNGIMFFNMETLPNKQTLNFNCGSINGNHTDTGGFTYYYLKENPNIRIDYMRNQLDLTDGDFVTNSYELEERGYLLREGVLSAIGYNSHLAKFIESNPDDMQFFLDYAFLHYRRAGNYNHKSNSYHQKKTELLNHFIESIIQGPDKPYPSIGQRAPKQV